MRQTSSLSKLEFQRSTGGWSEIFPRYVKSFYLSVVYLLELDNHRSQQKRTQVRDRLCEAINLRRQGRAQLPILERHFPCLVWGLRGASRREGDSFQSSG
jgi:hypothetical protein